MINAIVMASGYSRRMGKSNKLLLDLNGLKIIEYILVTLKKSNIYNVILVANDSDIFEIGRKYNCKIQVNNNAQQGISASIKEGCKQCLQCDGVMLTQADQPLLTVKTINKLIDASTLFPDKIIRPTYNDINASPVIFPKKYIKDLMGLKGDKGGRVIINRNKDEVVYVAVKNVEESYDIDTEEDLNRIKYILGNKEGVSK